MAPKLKIEQTWVSEVADRIAAAAVSARKELEDSNCFSLGAVPKAPPWRRPKAQLTAEDELASMQIGNTAALAFHGFCRSMWKRIPFIHQHYASTICKPVLSNAPITEMLAT